MTIERQWAQLDVTVRNRSTADEILSRALRLSLSRSPEAQFFFMRKPPGLRLRWSWRKSEFSRKHSRAAFFGRSLRADGLASAATFTCYEPETFAFGGPEGMSAFHSHFDADSRVIIRHLKLQRRGLARLSKELLSVAAFNDLLSRIVQQPEEIWDVWCRVAVLNGCEHLIASDEHRPSAPYILLSGLLPVAHRAERALIQAYEKANSILSRRIGYLRRSGRFLSGTRHALSLLIQFHYNRLALDVESRRRIVTINLGATDLSSRLERTVIAARTRQHQQ